MKRVTPVQNFRLAMKASRREQDYNRRNVKIAIVTNVVIGGILLAMFGGRTALQGLAVCNGAVLGFGAVATMWVNWRSQRASGLAVIRATTDASLDDVMRAMRDSFNGEPQRTESEGLVLLACETSRSNLSYGEWILVSISVPTSNGVSVQALSWNVAPTATFGTNARNLRRLADAIPLRDVKQLPRKPAEGILDEWSTAGRLIGDLSPRPSWYIHNRPD